MECEVVTTEKDLLHTRAELLCQARQEAEVRARQEEEVALKKVCSEERTAGKLPLRADEARDGDLFAVELIEYHA